MSRKFGWHSGTLTAQDGKFKGDLYVQDDIVFSDVSAGTLGVTGGIDMQGTTSAIGIDLGGTFSTTAILIDGTCNGADVSAINIDLDYDLLTIGSEYPCAFKITSDQTSETVAGDGGMQGFRSDTNNATFNNLWQVSVQGRATVTGAATINDAIGVYAAIKTVGAVTAYAATASLCAFKGDVSDSPGSTWDANVHGIMIGYASQINYGGKTSLFFGYTHATAYCDYGLLIDNYSPNMVAGIYLTETAGATPAMTTGILIDANCTTAIHIYDDMPLVFGNGSDVSILYDETTDDRFEINSKKTALLISGRVDITTGYETMFLLEGTLNSTGSAGGVKTRGLQIDLERTTATVANGDSRDQALKIDIKDSVGDHTAGYFIRAMDVKSEFDAAGKTITALYGANFTTEVDNGTATDYMNVSFNSKVDGVVTNDAVNVRIYDESQGSITGDVIGLQFATKSVAPATGQREHVIEITQADSSGWQNFVHFTNAADGYTCVKTGAYCDTDAQDSDAAIRVDIAGTAYYIPLFNAAHTSSSW